MPLKGILLSCLAKKGLTTVFELINYFQQKETPFIKITKQGHLLLVIDGSKAEVPNSKENREVFGVSANQYLKQSSVRALVSGMYDLFR